MFHSHSSAATITTAVRPLRVTVWGPCDCARSMISLNFAFASATLTLSLCAPQQGRPQFRVLGVRFFLVSGAVDVVRVDDHPKPARDFSGDPSAGESDLPFSSDELTPADSCSNLSPVRLPQWSIDGPKPLIVGMDARSAALSRINSRTCFRTTVA